MAAKVVYTGGVSYTVGGKKWMQGKPDVLTDENKIAKFRQLPGFTVTDVKAPSKKKPSKKKATKDEGEPSDKPVKKKKKKKKKTS